MKIVTHDGVFHADEAFAVATILLKFGNDHEIIRTRDPQKISSGDFVVDVGGEYIDENYRFDHHQGPSMRENKAPYASFGLVWKKFGAEVCGSQEAAEEIDRRVVQPIDTEDNGIELVPSPTLGVYPYAIAQVIKSFRPTWDEEQNFDKAFIKVVTFAKQVLEQEILHAQAKIKAAQLLEEAYKKSADKRILILDRMYPYSNFTDKHQEIYFVVFPRDPEATMWGVNTVSVNSRSLVSRKFFPEQWAGKRDVELERITGVPGAVFCHLARFIAIAKSKEGAIRLAEIALAS